MNRAKDLADKHHLWALIKRLAALWDEGDPTLAGIYARDVYEAYMKDLDRAIRCFTDLVKQAEVIFRNRAIELDNKNSNK